VDKRNDSKRGWVSLEETLRTYGINGSELEEARDSFSKGIEILSKIFLSCYLAEINKSSLKIND